MALSIGKKN
jgi:hypothetical protein